MRTVLSAIALLLLAASIVCPAGERCSLHGSEPLTGASRRGHRLAHDVGGEGSADAERRTCDPALGVPAYNCERALHGVAQGAPPSSAGHRLAATWDTELLHRVADTISTEARAKYHEGLRSSAPDAAGHRAPLPAALPA